ncbi:amino acid ABC transporter permease [Caenimonas sp. SL110]|uniref:amino acid ABC transporter permease n=1 Tax=Caenimonas sp. SL110 TaxID=1450524 RepID=UPI000652EA94|nr:amino acid ABC transporter permease [Caenimonas sp. SL110]
MFGNFHPLALLQGPHGIELWAGLRLTLFATLAAWLIAYGVGILLAAIRSLPSKTADRGVAAYVAYHRNVPLLVQVLYWYFGVVTLLPNSIQQWTNDHGGGFYAGVVALGLCMAAYVSEDLRSGMRTVPHGHIEASRAIGLTFAQTMAYVVLPQALRAALPALVNNSLLLFKNTSLLMAIGVAELTYAARQIEGQTFKTFEVFTIATVIYLSISLVIMATGHLLEQRYRTQRR